MFNLGSQVQDHCSSDPSIQRCELIDMTKCVTCIMNEYVANGSAVLVREIHILCLLIV